MRSIRKALLSIFLFILIGIMTYAFKDTEFQYPSKNSLKAMKSISERALALQIREEILKNIPTSTLIEICLEYPLYPDILFYDSGQQGIAALITQFNGLKELMNRKDKSSELLKIYCKTSPVNVNYSWPEERIGEFITQFK